MVLGNLNYVVWFLLWLCFGILDFMWLMIYKTNVMGTLNMLGLAKRIGARFLLTSTSEVYGDPLEHPQKETYWGNVNPIGEWVYIPKSCWEIMFYFIGGLIVMLDFRWEELLWWRKANCRDTDHGLSSWCWRWGNLQITSVCFIKAGLGYLTQCLVLFWIC